MNKHNWINALQQTSHSGDAYALATVLGCSGSTPREPGSKMLITGEESFDTIGGGHLEFVVISKARELLAKGEALQEIHHFPLGASLGQCCGGSATVLLEVFAAEAMQVAVFGAGHVAQSLISILGGLPCRVSWIDNRQEWLDTELPANVNTRLNEFPVDEVASLPAGSDVLILTHNHQLDFELCVAALNHGGLRHIGLIGSQTKAERFRKRLAHRGFSEKQIATIQCPVGLSAVPGKLPMEVAVSIAAELIVLRHQAGPNDEQSKKRRGLQWKAIKETLNTKVDKSGQGYRLPVAARDDTSDKATNPNISNNE